MNVSATLRTVSLSDFRRACPAGITTGQLQRAQQVGSLSFGLAPMEAATGRQIGVVSISSCRRAFESLLPSGQAGRRAFFLRPPEVAGSCGSHWGKPKGNRRAKERDTASTIPISSGLAPEGSQLPSYNKPGEMPSSPSGLSRWKQRLGCYSPERSSFYRSRGA